MTLYYKKDELPEHLIILYNQHEELRERISDFIKTFVENENHEYIFQMSEKKHYSELIGEIKSVEIENNGPLTVTLNTGKEYGNIIPDEYIKHAILHILIFLNKMDYKDAYEACKVINYIEERLNKKKSSDKDCYLCGNCCKELFIEVDPKDIKKLSSGLNISEEKLRKKFIDRSINSWNKESGIVKKIKNEITKENECIFLKEIKPGIYHCTIHEFKPGICENFKGNDRCIEKK